MNSEKSSFQVIDDRAGSKSVQNHQEPRNWIEIDQKSESESERDAAKDAYKKAIEEINSRVEQNEQEILKLKAEVKIWTQSKSKSMVEQRAESDADPDESENAEDKGKVITENGSSENAEPSRGPSIICWLMLLGLSAIAAFLAYLVFSLDHRHLPKEGGRGREENTQKVSKENSVANVDEKITKDIFLFSQKFYEGSKYVVSSWNLNQNACYNLDKTGDDSASSIDTQGECIYVFRDSDCRGAEHKFSKETTDQHDLNLWGLDKKISSIQACHKHKHKCQD